MEKPKFSCIACSNHIRSKSACPATQQHTLNVLSFHENLNDSQAMSLLNLPEFNVASSSANFVQRTCFSQYYLFRVKVTWIATAKTTKENNTVNG